MTLKKALRRLRSYLKYRKPDPDDNFYEAVQLGEEALKKWQFLREGRAGISVPPLPGETEE